MTCCVCTTLKQRRSQARTARVHSSWSWRPPLHPGTSASGIKRRRPSLRGPVALCPPPPAPHGQTRFARQSGTRASVPRLAQLPSRTFRFYAAPAPLPKLLPVVCRRVTACVPAVRCVCTVRTGTLADLRGARAGGGAPAPLLAAPSAQGTAHQPNAVAPVGTGTQLRGAYVLGGFSGWVRFDRNRNRPMGPVAIQTAQGYGPSGI